jgi:hypothetical protein
MAHLERHNKLMSTCPHCGKPANPLRLSLYATTVSYTCVACKKKSRFDRRMMGAIGSTGIIGVVLVKSLFHPEGMTSIATVVGGTLVLMAAMYFLLRLRPVAE